MAIGFYRIAAGIVIATITSNVADAAITTIGYWRMGEGDSGAKAGQTISATADQTGNFTLTGAAAYSSDVKSGIGSTLSAQFSGSSALTFSTPVTTLTDNFGIEAWVKCSDLTKNSSFINNGSTGGYGLLLSNGAIYTIFNGVAVLPGVWPPSGGYVPTASEWFHVAVVRSNGVATLYINGVAYGTTTLTQTPNDPSTGTGATFKIGSGFVGNIDEVRVFTFESGKFQVSDLQTPVPEPASLGFAGSTAALLVMRARPRH